MDSVEVQHRHICLDLLVQRDMKSYNITRSSVSHDKMVVSTTANSGASSRRTQLWRASGPEDLDGSYCWSIYGVSSKVCQFPWSCFKAEWNWSLSIWALVCLSWSRPSFFLEARPVLSCLLTFTNSRMVLCTSFPIFLSGCYLWKSAMLVLGLSSLAPLQF